MWSSGALQSAALSIFFSGGFSLALWKLPLPESLREDFAYLVDGEVRLSFSLILYFNF